MGRPANRTRLLVAGVAALVAVVLALAVAGAESISPAPLPAGRASVEVVAEAPAGTPPRVVAVAVDTTLSSLRADPGVAAADGLASGSTTIIHVSLRTDDVNAAVDVVDRLRSTVDPGPLTLSFRAPALFLDGARASIQGQAGKLELLVAPVVLLTLFAVLGLGGGLTSVVATAAGLAAAVLAVRATGGYLFAVAPAAAIAMAQAIELSGLHHALVRQEGGVAANAGAVPDVVRRRWLPGALATTAVRALGPLALLATSFEGNGSIAIASFVAAVVAFLTVLWLARPIEVVTAPESSARHAESRVARALHGAPRVLARSRARLAGALGAAVLVSLVIAFPAHEAAATPLVSAVGGTSSEILSGIGIAALIFGAGVAALLALGQSLAARLRLSLIAPFSLLAAVAATGFLVFAVQRGHLAGLAGQRSALVGGSLAACLVAVGTIAAGRSVLVAFSARDARSSGVGATGAAELAAALTLPAVLASTTVILGCFGVLCAADLDAAREVGLGVSFGVVFDLLVVRAPLLAFLARWGQ